MAASLLSDLRGPPHPAESNVQPQIWVFNFQFISTPPYSQKIVRYSQMWTCLLRVGSGKRKTYVHLVMFHSSKDLATSHQELF